MSIHARPFLELKPHIRPPAEEVFPGENDVVFGRDLNTLWRPNSLGNLIYKRLVKELSNPYSNQSNVIVRKFLVQSIVNAIKGRGGRFLEWRRSNEQFVGYDVVNCREVDYLRAATRTNQELFECRNAANSREKECYDGNDNDDDVLDLIQCIINPDLLATVVAEEQETSASQRKGNETLSQRRGGALNTTKKPPNSYFESVGMLGKMSGMVPVEDSERQKNYGHTKKAPTDQRRPNASILESVYCTNPIEKRKRTGSTIIQRKPTKKRQRQPSTEQQLATPQLQETNSWMPQSTKQRGGESTSENLMAGDRTPINELHKITRVDVLVSEMDSKDWKSHAGNHHFRQMLDDQGCLCKQKKDNSSLLEIARSITTSVFQRKGRFLRRNIKTNPAESADSWSPIEMPESVEWTLLLLRRLHLMEPIPEKTSNPAYPKANGPYIESDVDNKWTENQTTKKSLPALPSSVTPKPSDVLWSKKHMKHPGNSAFLRLILDAIKDVNSLPWDELKICAVARSTTAAIKSQNGRFLESCESKNENDKNPNHKYMVWREISNARVVKATMGSVRDARLKLMRNFDTTEKEQINIKKKYSGIAAMIPVEADIVFENGATMGGLKHPRNIPFHSLTMYKSKHYHNFDAEAKKQRLYQPDLPGVKDLSEKFPKVDRNTCLGHAIQDNVKTNFTQDCLQRCMDDVDESATENIPTVSTPAINRTSEKKVSAPPTDNRIPSLQVDLVNGDDGYESEISLTF